MSVDWRDAATYRAVRKPEGWLGVEPVPTEDELRAFYVERYYQELASTTYQASYDEEELAYKRLRADVTLLALQQAGFTPDTGAMVEVGAGEGFFLQRAVDAGWDVTGVDHSSYATAQFNPAVAHLLVEGDAETHLAQLARDGIRVEVCVLVNVLEHVRDPAALLRLIREVLTATGIVVVTVPNDDSPLQHELRRRGDLDNDPWFVPPQHLAYFNTTTGPAFARSCDFGVVDLFSDFPIDWFLLHPGANYVADPAQGKPAHRARITTELLLGRAGLDRVLDLGRAMAACGAGRDLTMLLRIAS